MSTANLCLAIGSKRVVRFYYGGDGIPGYRIVEPHMVAYNRKENLVLSGWYLSGASESSRGPGWREYLVSSISDITILDETFQDARPGYQPSGGKTFHDVQCAL
jgi:hypothetical protein